MAFALGPRRGHFVDLAETMKTTAAPLSAREVEHFEFFDLVYRSLVALLYNYVPTSGHPGGSISSGRFVQGLLFDAMDYDVGAPAREDADIVSYAAGHKALGLYALWALRNEVMRVAAPELLPADERQQLRLEDLLGFRRNPTASTPLFARFGVKALDGHPTPATPFVRLSTGASGVGVSASLGLAYGARDAYGTDAPRVHIVEGEGGMTPGRVAEALAAAGTASLDNARLHVDWNQASIDSNQVCRDGEKPGDYVQWTPAELAYLHDWNVIAVPDGRDFQQIVAAQRLAAELDTGQPTAIVYRTVKGWLYGIEGRASHGAGHALCSDAFYAALKPLLGDRTLLLPSCKNTPRCGGADGAGVMEACFWDALQVLRVELQKREATVRFLADRLHASRERLTQRGRKVRANAPSLEKAFELAEREGGSVPESLRLAPGTVTTLRNELGRVLSHYNQVSGGALFVMAADLLGSTSVNKIAEGFPPGYWNARTNPEARTLSVGGICEDAMAGVCSGLGTFGHHIGVASSYAAFIAPLGHIAARLHAIGNQARVHTEGGGRYRPMILVGAHAGLKTGEDGPTHADPQALQLLQENFPPGTCVTLTPWDPAEMWTLVSAALAGRPALIAPFVTRPNETVPDRARLGLAPVTAAATGVYRLRAPRNGSGDGVLVLQESAVTLAFTSGVLPRLEQDGVDLDVYYVASAELFDALPQAERERIFPEARAQEAMGITGFTLATMYRWVRSDRGRAATLHPYVKGHFPGSGQGPAVLAEAGLDAEGQYRAIKAWLGATVRSR